jgi:hypothetical protein
MAVAVSWTGAANAGDAVLDGAAAGAAVAG